MPEMNPIQVVISVADETNGEPMGFWVHEDGASFDGEYTHSALTICVAILRDLADMLEKKISLLTN